MYYHYKTSTPNTPPDEKTRKNISLQNTTSGAGEQYLLLRRKAKVCVKVQGVCLFTDT